MKMIKNDSSGFTLIHLVVALSLSLLVAMGMATLFAEMREGSSRNSAQVSQMTLVNNIRFSAANFVAMNLAALENRKAGTTTQLVDCVCGKSTCATNKIADVRLYDVGGNKISGTLDKPMYYNVYGDPCEKEAENCLFKATSQFVCIGSNCGDSSSMTDGDPVLRISYRVAPIEGKKTPLLEGSTAIAGPDIDIAAKSSRDYAIENNLCVQVTSYAPHSGFAKGGEVIEFQGSGLTDVQKILIDGKSCSFIERSLLKMKCRAPLGVEGAKNIAIHYGGAGSPEIIAFPKGYTYLPNPSGNEGETNTCFWHEVGTCGSGECGIPRNLQLPPCIEGNTGEQIKTGGAIYECRC